MVKYISIFIYLSQKGFLCTSLDEVEDFEIFNIKFIIEVIILKQQHENI